MTASLSYTHSPFLYHHVPNSPFLMQTRPQTTQSPVAFVPDVDNSRNSHSSGGLLRNGEFFMCPHTGSLLSPVPVVPSVSNPPTPQVTSSSTNVSSYSQKEQVVPHFSPMVENNLQNRRKRRLDISPNQAVVPELDLFSGEEIFA